MRAITNSRVEASSFYNEVRAFGVEHSSDGPKADNPVLSSILADKGFKEEVTGTLFSGRRQIRRINPFSGGRVCEPVVYLRSL